jgi:hypothetical protein
MAPERQRHLRVKGAVYRAPCDAVARAGVPYTVFPDGATVVTDDEHARERSSSSWSEWKSLAIGFVGRRSRRSLLRRKIPCRHGARTKQISPLTKTTVQPK